MCNVSISLGERSRALVALEPLSSILYCRFLVSRLGSLLDTLYTTVTGPVAVLYTLWCRDYTEEDEFLMSMLPAGRLFVDFTTSKSTDYRHSAF